MKKNFQYLSKDELLEEMEMAESEFNIALSNSRIFYNKYLDKMNVLAEIYKLVNKLDHDRTTFQSKINKVESNIC